MAIWHQGGLGGFDSSAVELTGRLVGQGKGLVRFHDGIGIRWLPKEHIISYRRLGDGYYIITIPSWLAKRRRFRKQ